MKVKGVIDYDPINYKEPVLTIMMPQCDFKCDKLNGCQVCQNSALACEPDIEISFERIWELYEQNPLTKGFCLQGLEPFDSLYNVFPFISFIRKEKHCQDPIIIYTGYNRDEIKDLYSLLRCYNNLIVKWGRFIMNQEPHYDEVLGVQLASNNQFAEKII